MYIRWNRLKLTWISVRFLYRIMPAYHKKIWKKTSKSFKVPFPPLPLLQPVFFGWHHLWRRNHFGLHLLGDRYHCGYFVWISPEFFSRWKIENQRRIGWPDVWRGQHVASHAWRQFNSETWKYLEIRSGTIIWTMECISNLSFQIYHLNPSDLEDVDLGHPIKVFIVSMWKPNRLRCPPKSCNVDRSKRRSVL